MDSMTGNVVAVSSFYDDGMTDYSALVWNPETLVCEWRSCTYSTKVDGPAWVVALVAIHQDLQRIVREERAAVVRAQEAAERAEIEAREVRKGRDVVVVRGRKVAKGTTGRCFWVGACQYGTRVGIETASGETHWTAISNVEVIQTAAAS